LDTKLQSGDVKIVVCGRFERIGEEKCRPDEETDEIIQNLVDYLRRRELHPYVSVRFCNCGNAEEHGPSITVLPEKVRYLDLEEETLENIVDRHVEDSVGEDA
jgi:(2Fe-2S) ferredoxin